MKYIRTKDGIFRRYKNSKIIDNVFYYPDDGMLPEYRREPILKQADTIEELCDEVVVVYPNGSHSNHFCYDYKSFYESIEGQVGNIGDIPYTKENLNEYEIYEIYGAIWTDKGLIFVARMNNEGVLELL